MKRWFVFGIILMLLLIPALVLADSASAQVGAGENETLLEKKLEVEDLSFELGVILNIRIKEQNCKMAG